MSLTQGHRHGVAAASLGMHPSHTIEVKFAALQKAGIKEAELGLEGFVTWVRQQYPDLPPSTAPEAWSEGGEPDPADDALWLALYHAAPRMTALAGRYGLKLSVFQPLNQFEGWPADSERSVWVRRKAEKWLPLCAKLGVEFLQVGSNDQPEATAPLQKYAEDLRWLAELASKQTPPIKIAYESWCFSKHVNSWEQTWDIVKAGNHPNLGLCLDVAHFPLAPQYGFDSLTGSGFTASDFEALVKRIQAVPAEKIFYVELADVVDPAKTKPLGQGSIFDAWRTEHKPARGDRFTWAVCGRPVPLVGRNAGREEEIGGARVVEAMQAILSTGFRGLFMFEQFEAQFQAEDDADIPDRYAAACAESWTRLVEATR